MKSIYIFLLLLLFHFYGISQCDTTSNIPEAKKRYGLWFTPSFASEINGLGIGLISSYVPCNRPWTQTGNGVTVVLFGQGIFNLIGCKSYSFQNFFEYNMVEEFHRDTAFAPRNIQNGLVVSTFGTFTEITNGVSLSFLASQGETLNGLSINLVRNFYHQMHGVSIGMFNTQGEAKGVQIGLVNKAAFLQGFQFGLWNRNQKRSMPIVNWCFT